MTVEEGIRSILASGVATDERATAMPDPSLDGIRTVADIDRLRDVVPGAEPAEPESDEDDYGPK